MKNYGKRLILAVMAICACLLPLATVQALKSSSAVPVTSILNDTGVVADGTNYRVQSDNVSTDYFNGLSHVSSIFQGIGDWVLDTSASTTRAVLIDLRAPVPGSRTNPPFELDGILDLFEKGVPGLAFLRREVWRPARIAAVDSSNCGNEEDALFFHQLDILAVSGMAVLDGVHSGRDSLEDAFWEW